MALFVLATAIVTSLSEPKVSSPQHKWPYPVTENCNCLILVTKALKIGLFGKGRECCLISSRQRVWVEWAQMMHSSGNIAIYPHSTLPRVLSEHWSDAKLNLPVCGHYLLTLTNFGRDHTQCMSPVLHPSSNDESKWIITKPFWFRKAEITKIDSLCTLAQNCFCFNVSVCANKCWLIWISKN